MTRLLSFAAAVAALVLVLGWGEESEAIGRATVRPDGLSLHTTHCFVLEGFVWGYLPQRRRVTCAPNTPRVGTTLHPKDRLTTGATGQLDFSTNHLNYCVMLARSADVILPTSKIALRHETGTTWCEIRPGEEKTLTTQGTTIKVIGTILGLETHPSGAFVKVQSGRVLVSGSEIVTEHSQVFIPRGGIPGKPQPFEPTGDERRAITSINLAVLTMPLGAVPQFFKLKKQNAGALIAGNRDILRRVSTKFPGLRLTSFAKDMFLTSSNPIKQLEAEGLRIVVGAGSFDELVRVFERLRENLGPRITLVFVPA
jgi:hypothetical protein